MRQKSKNYFLKQGIEWGIMLVLLLVFFSARSQIQQLLLYTGIFNAKTDITSEEKAEYQFQLISDEGQILDFENLKGKVIFMNLWATWCPPCIAEMPDIHKLYQEVSTDDIAFVMLSVDENPQKARDFIARKGYTFPIYFLKSPMPQVYSSNSIPTTFVISPEGNIVSKNYGMANYNNASFKEFLQELSP